MFLSMYNIDNKLSILHFFLYIHNDNNHDLHILYLYSKSIWSCTMPVHTFNFSQQNDDSHDYV